MLRPPTYANASPARSRGWGVTESNAEIWDVIYVLMRHAGDPEQAIIRAVNDTKDSDTVAAIVGAAVGALHGRRALPDRWVHGLLGRTREDDDCQVFALVESAWERVALRSGGARTPA